MAENDKDKNESGRILARVERESAGGGFFSSTMLGGKRGAPSADDDWIEHWGTRIGRMIGIAVAAALMVWIVLYALNLI
ncbi:MAG TPA: hypothetical protein VMF90_19300 [Rhizobiaceae bacterium]|nr:hypothetical protein [Rhizobiaceae bacterium]